MDPRRIKLIDQVNFIKDRKKQVYTFSVITFLVLVVLSVGAVKPSLETIIRLRSEIKEKKSTLDQLETKMNTLNSLNSQFVDFEDTAKDLELLFPANGDFSLFLANIESLAEDSGFKLTAISFSSRRSRAQTARLALVPVEINLNIEGERDRLVPFMKKLESLPMYPEIRTLSFNNQTILQDEDEDDEDQNDENNDQNNQDEEQLEVMTFSLTMHIYAVNNDKFYD